MGLCRVDERCCRGRSICAGAWLFGSRACPDRMGRRRKRRTPSWVIPCGALARRIEGCLQPPGNTPQPPSTNVVPAHDQHPHEIALNGLAFVAPGQEPPRPYPRLRHAKRLPSPARPAVGNSDRSIAGEGRGWGDNELSWSRLRVVRREARLRKAPHPAFGHLVSFKRGPRQLQWNTLLCESLSAAKALAQQRPTADPCHLGRERPWRSLIVVGLATLARTADRAGHP